MRRDIRFCGITFMALLCINKQGKKMTTQITVSIYSGYNSEKIGSFKTSSKDIQKAFYSHVSKHYAQYQLCPTECFYKLSN
jgi:Cdc6-like AAA superfamily ATPase